MPINYVDLDLKRVQGYLLLTNLSGKLDIEILGAIDSELSEAGDLIIPAPFEDRPANKYSRIIKVHPFIKVTSDYSTFPFEAVNEETYRFGTIQYGLGFYRTPSGEDGFIDTPINYDSYFIKYPLQTFNPFTIVVNYPTGGTGDYIVPFQLVPEIPVGSHIHPPTDTSQWAGLPFTTATSMSVSLRKDVEISLQYFYTVQAIAFYNVGTDTFENIYTPPT